jgi:hypothetical protein
VTLLNPASNAIMLALHARMVLEFGDYDAEDRMQPGRIYICLPDRAKSVSAGTFEAAVE